MCNSLVTYVSANDHVQDRLTCLASFPPWKKKVGGGGGGGYKLCSMDRYAHVYNSASSAKATDIITKGNYVRQTIVQVAINPDRLHLHKNL